jgi:TonB family protein
MSHGIDGYFEALARDQRRVASCGALVLCAFLAAELIAARPRVVAALNDPKRFGFEGPEQYVRRILLEQIGDVDQPGLSKATLMAVDLHRGGGAERTAARTEGTTPAARTEGPGVGDDLMNLQSRLRALAFEGPVIRSEDLVVEKLVRPEYPEEARAADIEGVVEMVALVDTTGAVTEVHIIGGTHHPALERAATGAVLQCRYRPYRMNAFAQQVWAYYRIHFTLY